MFAERIAKLFGLTPYLDAIVGPGFDERMTRPKVVTLWARALQRAFPALYAYVEPLVKPEAIEWARAEIARNKAAKKAGGQRESGKPDEPGKPRRRRKA